MYGQFKNYWQENSGDYQASPWTNYNQTYGQPTQTAQAPSTMAKTQPVDQTAPQGEAAPRWISQGSFNLPTFDDADLQFGDKSWVQNPGSASMGDYGDGVAKEGDGYWNYGDVSINPSAYGNYGNMLNGMGGSSNNWATSRNEDGSFNLQVKSGDKVGTSYRYNKVGDRWMPDLGTRLDQKWDTNAGNRTNLLGLTAVLGGALGGALLAPAAEGAAAAGATGGAVGSTVGQGTLAELMAGCLGGTGGGLGGGITAGAGAAGGGLLPTGAAGTLGGSFGGLTQIGAYGGAVGGSLGGLAGSGGAGMGGSFLDTMKEGYDIYSKAKRGMNLFNQFTQDSAGPARPYGGMQGGGGLLGMGAGLWSDHQNRDSFTGLNDLFSRQEQQRAGYQQQLMDSYTNPNHYLQSPEFQALNKLEENRLDRKAGAAGRLSNDADRAVLLQDFAQKGLSNYRSGLTSALNANQLPYGVFQDAMKRNANAGGPTAGGMGYSGLFGSGGTLNDIFNGGKSIYNWLNQPNYGNASGLDGVDLSGAGDSWDFNGTNYGNMPGLDVNIPWDDFDSWDISGWF